ncbi:MAG: ankyrin repeat domain-containing protein, partial [Pseudomonadota bacterium]|nr:ankyrin repeat domain-containing protein [Pseudomonadota bacterium]MEC8585871.1 ankyrin repeat domain-containing protein [Pseudomonadota bacterium]
ADRVRILDAIRRAPGIDAVNSLCKGAVSGANWCMSEREVLRAALGDGALLAAVRGREALERALCAAAAGGLMAPLEALLARPEEVGVEAADEDGMTALMQAANGGHAAAVEALVARGASVEAVDEGGIAALDFARDDKVRAILDAARVAAFPTSSQAPQAHTALAHALATMSHPARTSH